MLSSVQSILPKTMGVTMIAGIVKPTPILVKSHPSKDQVRDVGIPNTHSNPT